MCHFCASTYGFYQNMIHNSQINSYQSHFMCSSIKRTMPRGKRLNEVEKAKISALRENSNLPIYKIAQKINRSEKVVRNYLKDREKYGKKVSSGRRPTISNAQKRRLIRNAANSLKSAAELKAENQLEVSVRRVQQILHNSKRLKYKKMKRKPKLTKSNIKARREFADKHLYWDHQWRKIIFSDEKKFNLDGPDGFAYYWHDLRTEERIFSKRQSGGGSVMVWAAIGYQNKSDLSFIDTRMNAVAYQRMIAHHLPAYGNNLAGPGWKFQQDNAPIHVARSTMAFFKETKINILDKWPPKSADMNIIENLWSILAREVYRNNRQYANQKELKVSIVKAWHNISQRQIQKLFDSLPRRMQELSDKKGKETKY